MKIILSKDSIRSGLKTVLVLGFIIILSVANSPAKANDYSLATNIIMRKWVPWWIAVILIENNITRAEERTIAVQLLMQYKSKGLVSHLKTYSNDPIDSVRIATFWPLYKNGQREFAIALLNREIKNKNLSTVEVFCLPYEIYKLKLSRNDLEFHQLVEQIAKDSKIDPWIRISTAIHLTQIGNNHIAGEIATKILMDIPPDPVEKDYNSWHHLSKMNSHLRKRAEWCLKLARQD